MFHRHTLWRHFITSLPLQALTIGILATLLAKLLWLAAPATFTALDWTVYDTWLRHRAPIAVSPALTIIARDPVSEAQFGAGSWDRAILAQLITTAHETGAAAIGIDHRFNQASPPHLGGAASDALLLEATTAAGHLVTVFADEAPPAMDAIMQGHLILSPHSDHVARSLPFFVEHGSQTLPAFGLALFSLTKNQPLPHETGATGLVNAVGNGTLADLPTIPLSNVWGAIQRHDSTALDGWMKDKVVVILSQPPAQNLWLLPTGQSVDGMTAHLQFLNSLLTDNRLCQTGPLGRAGITMVFAAFIAWCLLRFHGSISLVFAAGVIALYAALTAAVLGGLHLVLPVALPLTAALIVLLGTTAWTHLTAGQRMMLLEQDMLRIQQDTAAVREALVLRESRADALQEDLDAAKAAAAQSAGQRQDLARATESLRAELADVQMQEQTAREQLEGLERQLHDLRAAGSESETIGDTALTQLAIECRQLGIMTRDASLLRLFRDVKKGAGSPLTVLFLGEPGTGKELFARAVHRLSPRSSRTFIAVNMAAISPELFESELFGHTKGSFTGATADRRGYFELANHGTIFLDEIGDLRLDHQSKLLRVLQEKSFYRVGATMPTTVDVRIVAATNRDLQRGVSEGWFREDLYFRLKGLVFRLPPLRERAADIPLLADVCLAEIAGQMSRPTPKLSNEALHLLTEYAWPGNVREFRHALERAVALSDDPVLTRSAFSLEGAGATPTLPLLNPSRLLPEPAGDAAVLGCLRQHGFDMQATAKTLGWDRSTVTQRLKGLCFQALVESNGDQAKAALAIAGDPTYLRTVELKLLDYHNHLLSVIAPFKTADEALADCTRRFKNLPDRHFASVDTLVRDHFAKIPPP
ncbi:sigma 54-interacting transcriptional regulator [Nitrospira lenta]|uniref:Putative transmembrane signal transduction receptor and sigma-54 dependent response regulator n=1 Tax=Nitrospira lenta TaxID=1436998 RepID=A0A330L2P2_9BACT|nr:sigma 54-interacting transcriptional regulator [Nitrospira lenta]SPP63463.1 putative transmembrane signal transduction receptor and sigma-54 dependent response regulator [Nitrospira lenta]